MKILTFYSIVFVHGLFGHRIDTWTYKPDGGSENERKSKIGMLLKKLGRSGKPDARDGKPVFWPQDLLPSVIHDSRIFTWGYDVSIDHFLSSASQATLYDIAVRLAGNLVDERQNVDEVLTDLLGSYRYRY